MTKIMKERWRDIPGYEGYYEVSSEGRIRSLNRLIIDKNGKIYLIKSKIIKPQRYTNGYLFITLCKKSIKKPISVHRLVLLSFSPIPNDMVETNHIMKIKRIID